VPSAHNALVVNIGDRFGKLVVLGESRKISGARAFRLRCDCGTECIKKLINFTRSDKPARSCGCVAKSGDPSRTHGRSSTATYRIWHHVLQRCRNPNDAAYINYGGRGIKVCDRWLDFENFLADMGERPSPKHEITRKDNDGNYEPGNVEWSTDAVAQSRNRRKFKKTSSQYRGVGWWKSGNLWRARITLTKGQLIQIGCFKTELEAAEAYDAVARLHRGFILNFPENQRGEPDG
jgi:hypothetical protein